jgi:hypothetical protein
MAYDKELDVSGLVDIQAKGFSEKRFNTLLKSVDRSNQFYRMDVDDGSGTAFFEFPDKRNFALHRVQEVLTNVPKVHYLAVGLPLNVNIRGGRTPQDTVKEIKEHKGYVVVDHPYALTFKGNNFVQINRGSIDLLEYNGGLNSRAKISPFVGAGIAAVAGESLGLDVPYALLTAATISAFAIKPLEYSNYLAKKRAPVLDLELVGSSDAHSIGDIGKTRTRVFMPSNQMAFDSNLISNIIENIKDGNYQILSKTNSLEAFASHVLKGKYSQFRAGKKWFYDVPNGEELGLPSA